MLKCIMIVLLTLVCVDFSSARCRRSGGGGAGGGQMMGGCASGNCGPSAMQFAPPQFNQGYGYAPPQFNQGYAPQSYSPYVQYGAPMRCENGVCVPVNTTQGTCICPQCGTVCPVNCPCANQSKQVSIVDHKWKDPKITKMVSPVRAATNKLFATLESAEQRAVDALYASVAEDALFTSITKGR